MLKNVDEKQFGIEYFYLGCQASEYRKEKAAWKQAKTMKL